MAKLPHIPSTCPPDIVVDSFHIKNIGVSISAKYVSHGNYWTQDSLPS